MNEQKKNRFLLMEDDIALGRLLQRRLERQGFSVDHAGDGEVGLQMCKDNQYDLVIVDHKMPLYSGLEVIQELNKFEDSPPIIMVTGAGDERIAVQALKLGAHDYIVKDASSGYIELLPTVVDQVFRKIKLESEKLRAENALRESESRYRNLVELSPDAIFVLQDEAVVFVNEAGRKLLHEHSADDLINRKADLFVHFSSWSLFQEMIKPCEQIAPNVRRFEAQFMCRDNSILDVDVMVSCIQFDGKPAAQLVARDITSRKRAQSEISQMNDELEQMVEEQNHQLGTLHREMEVATQKLSMAQMATGALHNVKNVLNSLIVGTSMMGRILANSKVGKVGKVAQLLRDNESELGTFLSEGDRGKFLPDFLTSLATNLEREHEMVFQELQGLIKNLEHIKFSIQLQLSSTRLSESSEFISVNEIVEDALNVNRSAIQRNQISIQRAGTNLPPIPGSRHKVLQVLVNLISNAVNALEDTDRPDRRLEIELGTAADKYVVVSVADNGVGISKSNLDEVFAYGFTTRETGHGFGLHSCLQLVSEMGGKLEAESDGLGKGAAFRLLLPIEIPEEDLE